MITMTAKEYLQLQTKVYELTKCPPPVDLACRTCKHREIWSRVAQTMLDNDDYTADSFVKTYETHISNACLKAEEELGDYFDMSLCKHER